MDPIKRVCKKCGEEKLLEAFNSHKRFCANDYICFDCLNKIMSARIRKYQKKNRKNITKRTILQHLRHRDELSNWYIKSLLRYAGFDRDNITPELIELKRVQLQIHRLTKTN